MLDTATYTGRTIGEPKSVAPRASSTASCSADGLLSVAQEVARLLEHSGVDLRSNLGADLFRLANDQAREWDEMANQTPVPLSAKGAAVLGVRSAASQVMGWAQSAQAGQDVTAIQDACLRLSVAAERPASTAGGVRQRRWGEGAAPARPQRPAPLSNLG